MSLGMMGPSVTISSGHATDMSLLSPRGPSPPQAFPVARLMLGPEAQAAVGSWGLLSEFSLLCLT